VSRFQDICFISRPFFKKFVHLKKLHLICGGHGIPNIPWGKLSLFVNLEQLRVNTPFTYQPSIPLEHLTSLKKLSFERTSLSLSSLSRLNNLVSLFTDRCQDLEEVTRFTNLTKLRAFTNSMSCIEFDLTPMTRLVSLAVAFRSSDHLVKNVASLPNLVSLRLHGWFAGDFHFISLLTNLTHLDTRFHSLGGARDHISALTNLKSLAFGYKIDPLPEKLTKVIFLEQTEPWDLEPLRALSELRALKILGPAARKTGLTGLSGLRELTVGWTSGVTAEGAAENLPHLKKFKFVPPYCDEKGFAAWIENLEGYKRVYEFIENQ
jgi:hypothetical protein